MCLLFESIKIKDGIPFHLDLHQKRMDRSVRNFFGVGNKIQILDVLNQQALPKKGLFKCRIVYGKEINEILILPYKQKKIKSLRIVKCDEIEYEYKYADRQLLNKLLLENSDVDEIIIVKNGLITDTSYSNLVFWNGYEWHTPSSALLKGIQREFLIAENMIKPIEIRLSDLRKYQKVGLINAMMDMDEMPIIEIDKIQIA